MGESGFQQAVSLIITHMRTHTHTVPFDLGHFLPLADLLADACPVTVEKERGKEEGKESVCACACVCAFARLCVCARSQPVLVNRYPSRICELCLTPGRPCSALVLGVFFLLGSENVRGTSSFTPLLIEVWGH